MINKIKSFILDWCLSKKSEEATTVYKSFEENNIKTYDYSNNLKFVNEVFSDLIIKTPSGFRKIKRLFKTIKYDHYKVYLENGHHIICADNHIFITSEGCEIFAKNSVGVYINTDIGPSVVTNIVKMDTTDNMYDLEIGGNDHTYYTNGILSHNSTICAGYLLHQALFNTNKKQCILANKASTSREILDRYKKMLETVPFFLQPGIQVYNKGYIEFGNGSSCMAASCSSDAVRGFTFNCVTGETMVTILDKFNRPFDTQIKDVELKIKGCKTPKVLTKDGFQKFSGVKISEVQEIYTITYKNKILKCTHNHLLEFPNNIFIEAKNVCIGDADVLGNEIINIDVNKSTERVYDLINVDNGHTYLTNGISSHNCILMDEFSFVENADTFYTSTYPVISSGETSQVIIISTPNGMNLFHKIYSESVDYINSYANYKVTWERHPKRDEAWKETTIKNIGQQKFNQEYECEFLGSAGTLISGEALSRLTWSKPIKSTADLEVFEMPEPGEKYFITVDVAEGTNIDYSIINVTKVRKDKYKQVALFKSNSVSPVILPDYVLRLANEYNEAEVLIEVNSIGAQVANILYYEHEYENLIMTNKGTIAGGKGRELGLRITKKTKRHGCTTLKALIETGAYELGSHDAVEELQNFILKPNGTYSADANKHDDIVMTLVSFAWASDQDYFKVLMDTSGSKLLRDKYIEEMESDLLPFGFHVNGLETEEIII